MPMSSRITSGRNAAAASTPSRPSWAVRTSWPISWSIIARLSAASTLSSTTRMRWRAAAGACGSAPSGCSGVRRPDDRQADDELAALAVALAVGLDAAAVHLDQPLDDGQADAQAALRLLQRPVHLREQVEHSGQHVRPGCRRRCPSRG